MRKQRALISVPRISRAQRQSRSTSRERSRCPTRISRGYGCRSERSFPRRRSPIPPTRRSKAFCWRRKRRTKTSSARSSATRRRKRRRTPLQSLPKHRSLLRNPLRFPKKFPQRSLLRKSPIRLMLPILRRKSSPSRSTRSRRSRIPIWS